MNDTKKYWFPAKRYGWGWGFPRTWQGALVLAAFCVLVVAGGLTLPARYGEAAFAVYCGILSLILVVICWIKGEPPKWRWGKK